MEKALLGFGRAVRLVLLVVLALLFLIPFYLLVRNGLSTEQDITSPDWTFFPSHLRWSTSASCSTTPRCRWPARCSTRA